MSPKSRHMAPGRELMPSITIFPSNMMAIADGARWSESGEARLSSGMTVRIPMELLEMSRSSQSYNISNSKITTTITF